MSGAIRLPDAVRRVHRPLHRGRNEVVDADLSNYFGEMPHAELMKSVARRAGDGRMLGLVRAWPEMPVGPSTPRRTGAGPWAGRWTETRIGHMFIQG